MNEIRFAARNTPQGFHWAWYLVPCGTGAIVLLSAVFMMMPGERPATTLAANALPTAVKTTEAAPALAAKPLAGWPAPAAGAAIEGLPPTF